MSSSQIYWLHDHQIKENALDALIDLLRSNAWIEVAKDQSLVSLYTLVMVLLGKSESVGHTRASIALLGAINLPSGPQPSSLLTQLSILLELIVDIFNAAWQSEDHSEESREGAETDPPPPSLSLEGGGIIYSAVSQVSLLSLPPVNEAKDHFEFSSKKPVMQVDSGLGYRILLQVIQAWKQIFSRCGASPALLDQLEKTRWRECVKLAAKHSRHQVSSAAIDLLILLDQQQPGEGGKAVDEDLKAAFAEAEEGPEITDLKPLTSDEELDKDEETDSEMLEFLRSFLNASLSINEDEKDQQHPDGLFLGWTDISAAAEKEAKQVREAMDHLPDPLDKSRLCMKYDMLFGN